VPEGRRQSWPGAGRVECMEHTSGLPLKPTNTAIMRRYEEKLPPPR
jgi:hypothetical protein